MYSTCLTRGQHHAGEFYLADTERAPASRSPEPAQKKARKLPQGVETKTTRHDRVTFEVACKKPVDIRISGHAQLRLQLSLAVRTATFRNAGNAIEHEHRGQWELGIAWTEQLAPPAGQKILVLEGRTTFGHIDLSRPLSLVASGRL